MSTIAIPTPFAKHGLLYIASGYVGDQVRPVLVNLLERGRSVINGNDLIASIHKNAASHVLGGHTIVSKQYGTCQGVPR